MENKELLTIIGKRAVKKGFDLWIQLLRSVIDKERQQN